MSLDIYLQGETYKKPCVCPYCFNEHEATETEDFYEANITHNLNTMANEAGIYEYLWRAPENGVTHAKQLIEPLKKGIQKMEQDPKYFQQFNSSNGWGLYENFLPWLKELLANCMMYPEATVHTSR